MSESQGAERPVDRGLAAVEAEVRGAAPGYIMIGGFLGAGKSTALARLARWLVDRGRRVGLITNDQGTGLVDTLRLRAAGFPVEEIAGGCFCCRFDSLKAAADALTQETRPDVFLAEPVGSCTDLVASVSYPLRRIYGDAFAIAPLSVLVDPVRALRMFGLREGGSFSERVAYVYAKQLEEADLIVLNKCDVVDDAARDALLAYFAERFPRAERMVVSARDGTGMEAWYERVTTGTMCVKPTMELDYDRYAAGEAELGWMNATLTRVTADDADAGELLRSLATRLRERVAARGGEIAHLKITLSPMDDPGALALVSLVRNDLVPELAQELAAPVANATLVVNLRAAAEPCALGEALQEVLEGDASGLSLEHLECFRPARPRPTHRDVVREPRA